MLLDLFCQINHTTFYDQLRTKEQLGYIVWSDAVSVAGAQGFRVEIQSSSHDPVHLDERIENCIATICKEKLQSLTEEDFAKQGKTRSKEIYFPFIVKYNSRQRNTS